MNQDLIIDEISNNKASVTLTANYIDSIYKVIKIVDGKKTVKTFKSRNGAQRNYDNTSLRG